MYIDTEARGTAGCRPLQHLQVAVGITERGDRPATDMPLDSHGLAFLVVIVNKLCEFHDDGVAAAVLILQPAARSDDLFGRDAIDRLGPGPHEFDATAGNNE